MSATLETAEDSVHREMEAIFGSPQAGLRARSGADAYPTPPDTPRTPSVQIGRRQRRSRAIMFAIILLSVVSLLALIWHRPVQPSVIEERRVSANDDPSSGLPTRVPIGSDPPTFPQDEGVSAGRSTGAAGDRSGEITVRAFYAALGRGDGAEASAQVVPEKRGSPTYSADAMSRFYGALPQPIRLTRIEPVDSSSFRVSYRYAAGKTPCNGEAVIAIARREGRSFIQSIRALRGC